jgi:2-dehydro-3-deoxygluconokinase
LRENPLVWKNKWTAIAYSQGEIYRTRTYQVEIVDRLGAGDSFAAGLIHGLLDGDLQRGLDYGVAMSALKHSIPGDWAWVTKEEVERLLQGEGMRISR